MIKQPNRKLQPDEIDTLVTSYKSGASMRALSFEYDMHVKTVRAQLVGHGVQLRQAHVPKRWRDTG